MSEDFQGGYNPTDGMYYAKGSFDNEIEYNNEVICMVNHVEPTFQEIGKNIKEERFTLVEQMIATFIEENKQNATALQQLGSYHGDAKLLNIAINYLSEINQLIEQDYAQIIEMIKSKTSTPQELVAIQEKFGKHYHDLTSALSQAFQEFASTYFETNEFDPEVGGYNPADGVYYPKGSFDNEAEYYNEVIHLLNYKDDYINAIAQGLNNEDYKAVEELLVQFSQQNKTSIDKLKNLGDYEGDANLLNAGIAYLKTLDHLVKNEYQEMYEIHKSEARPMQEFLEKQAVFFQKTEEADQQLAEALEQFIALYDKDNLTQDPVNYNQENYTGMERKEYDTSNPFLQPIHGIAIEDYAAASAKMANGMSEEQVTKALGVELPQWDEANQLWQQRMQQDPHMVVIGLFGEFFGTAESHPKFQNLSDDSSMAANPQNLARIKEDPEFYIDLNAAMQAAYNYGIDGAQWLRENYGLSLGDFQSVAMQWAYSPIYIQLMSQMPERIKAHEDKFAEEMGGDIADDIEF